MLCSKNKIFWKNYRRFDKKDTNVLFLPFPTALTEVGCTTLPEAPRVTRLVPGIASGALVRFDEAAQMVCPTGLRLDTAERHNETESVEVTCRASGWEYPPAWPNCVDSESAENPISILRTTLSSSVFSQDLPGAPGPSRQRRAARGVGRPRPRRGLPAEVPVPPGRGQQDLLQQ